MTAAQYIYCTIQFDWSAIKKNNLILDFRGSVINSKVSGHLPKFISYN